MPCIIYRQISNYDSFNHENMKEEIMGICAKKYVNQIIKNIVNNDRETNEDTPKINNLKEQRDYIKKKIESLQVKRTNLKDINVPNAFRQTMKEIINLANQEINKNIGDCQKNLSKIEKQIENSKKTNIYNYYYKTYSYLRNKAV
jgi:hypothetical protein